MWRENESAANSVYAFGSRGLFPAPMSSEFAGTENGKRILGLFSSMGKFVARSMLDSRIIDINFNSTFFRVDAAAGSVTPSIGAVRTVDSDLANSLQLLKKFVEARKAVDEDFKLTPAQKVEAIQEIRINEVRVEDLALDFTLPGYPSIELIPGGTDIVVTIDNVAQYVEQVLDYTVGNGVKRQVNAFRAGFSQVFPYTALQAFTPNELVMLFGQVEEDWSLETLMDSIKADHGYNLDSKSVRNLLQSMSEFTLQERRDFLQFVTGSPKLPIGGKNAIFVFAYVVEANCHPHRFQSAHANVHGRMQAQRGSLRIGRLPAERHDVRQLPEATGLHDHRGDEEEAWCRNQGGPGRIPSFLDDWPPGGNANQRCRIRCHGAEYIVTDCIAMVQNGEH